MSIGSDNRNSAFGIPAPADIAGNKMSDLISPVGTRLSASATPVGMDVQGRLADGASATENRANHNAFGAPTPADAARRSGGKRAKRTSPPEVPQGSSEILVDDRSARRRKKAVIAVILAVLTVMSLFVDSGYTRFFDPAEVFACYGVWFQQLVASVASPADVVAANQILADHAAYFRILNRAGATVMTLICGAVLAIAGSLYQSAFRNPIASPSMLGVSSAIQFGDVILVLTYGAAAGTMLPMRYLICYACVIVLMLVLFGCARLMTGRKRPLNVVNLLLVAMILNQLVAVLVTYVTTYIFTWEMWEVFDYLSESLTVQLDVLSWAVLLVSCAIGLIPILVLRFRLNGLNFPDADMRLLGINASRLRLLALICGTILLMATQVQMGTVAMLALVVPHLSRMIFGAEFRKSLSGNVLIGAALLVACRIIAGFVPLVSPFLPISVVLNFVVLPFFVWMIAVQQRGWE